MRKFKSFFHNLLFSILVFMIGVTAGAPNAHAQIDNKQLEKVLNGLITPKLVNESNKPSLSDRSQVSETVDPASGTLTLSETDLALPGKDGLDLVLGRLYNSSQAEIGSKRVTVTTGSSYQVGSGAAYYLTLMYWDKKSNTWGTYFPGQYNDQVSAYNAAQHYINNQPDTNRNYIDYNIEYKSVQYVQDYYTTTTKIFPDENSYARSRYDLGSGWSMAFPSLEIDSGYIHYHDGAGAAYVVKFNSSNKGQLEDYPRNDVELLRDSTYSNGQMTSAYVLVDQSKNKTYFGNDGRLLGIKDRYGNEIKFTHVNRLMNGKTYPVISKIVDSIGRNVDFAYETNLSNPNFDAQNMTEKITITVSHPSTSEKKKIVYAKKREQVSIFENGTLSGKRYEPYLFSVTDLKGYSTFYEYYLASEKFDAQGKGLTNSAGTAVYLLQYAMYPHSSSFYEYKVITRNWGGQGAYQAFQITKRFDALNKYKYDTANPSIYAEGPNHQMEYTYFGDISGYPSYYAEESIPEGYRFGSESTNLDGLKTKYTFDGKKRMLSTEQTATNGEKVTETIQSYDTTYKYKPTKVESKVTSGSRENKIYQTFAYYPWGDLKSQTNPLTAAQLANPEQVKQHTTTYEYEPNFKLLSKQQYYQSASVPLTEQYTYDAQGRLKTSQNANGEIITRNFTQASDGRTEEVLVQLENGKTAKTVSHYSQAGSYQLLPTEVKSYYTDNWGKLTETSVKRTYDVLLGTMSSETNADNKTTQYQYDVYGRLLKTIYPVINNQNGERYQREDVNQYFDQIVENSADYFDNVNKYLITSRIDSYTKTTRVSDGGANYDNIKHEFYDGFGNAVLLGQLNNVKNEELILQQYHYDLDGRPTYVVDTGGNVSTASYDAWGRNVESVDPYGNIYRNEEDIIDRKNTSYMVAAKDVSAFRTSAQDSLKRKMVESFSDQWGRQTMLRAYPNWPNRSGGTIQEEFTYDGLGNVLTYTNPNRDVTKYQYDKLNRLVAVTDALNQTTSYGYDKLGNMLTTTQSEDAKSWTTSKGYDESGFLTSSTDTGGNQEKLTRNQLGQVAVKTDPNNNISNYIYDELGRGIFKVSVTGSTVLKNVYQFKGFGPSRKEEMRNGSNYMTVYNDYNVFGSQTYKATLYDGTVTVVRHEYNDQNQIKNVADAFDYFTNYSYDKTRISKVQTNGSHVVTTEDNANAQYSYNPDGKPERITYPRLSDGSYLTSDYNYDGIGRLVKLTNKKGTVIVSEFFYAYDNNSNITSIKDSVGTTNYQYDKLNRLIQVKRPSGETIVYTYDARGNRKTLKGNSGMVDSKEQTYTFNLWDQVSKVVKENTTTEFEYEMQGLRLAKTKTTVQPTNSDQNNSSQNPASSVEKVRYAYNNAGKVISEADANNKAIANYTWGPDRLLAKRDVSTNKKYFYLYNGHGDVVQLMDESGQIVNHYQYDEWGNIVEQEEAVRNDFKYAGEIFDDETGLYYLRARYYDPAIGRFVSKDTYEGQISNPLSQNLYTYVINNPLRYIDPSGNYCVSKNGKNSHSGGCSSSDSTYVPDSIYNANKNKSINTLVKLYNQQKSKAVNDSSKIQWITMDKSTAIPVPNVNSNTLVKALIQGLGLTAILGIEATSSQTYTPPKHQTLIYRNGRGGNINLTPRISDVTGLSYFTKPAEKKVTVTTIEAVNATKVLKAKIDNPVTGHVSVMAVDPYEHKLWMESRLDAAENPYYLTTILQSISAKL
jgi:RHS repeat-associated protein